MPHFFCRLNPPRANFIASMQPQERQLMQSHIDYWRPRLATRQVLALGPVMARSGDFGIAIIAGTDAEEIATLWRSDPAIEADVGFSIEISPMAGLIIADPANSVPS